MEDQNDLLNLLLSKDNLDVTLRILRDEQMIKEKIRRDFCKQLVDLAGEYGLELREQYNSNIVTWNSDYGWMIFVGKKKLQSQVGFVVGNFSRKNEDYGGMLYGLSIINGYFSNLGELKNVFPDFDKMCTYKITYPNFQAFSKNNLCKWVTQRLFFVSLHHVCT
mgnify:CR=1 FL=1